MDSISAELRAVAIELSVGKPSMMYNGALLWVRELLPRMVMLASVPRAPSDVVTTTPATLPVRAWSKFVTGAFINSPISTLLTEPVRSRLETVP